MASSHKLLVTGASGLLGRPVVKIFKQHGWEVLGTAYSRAKDGLVKIDLTDSTAVEKLIKDFKPTLIIHSAAERAPDKIENQQEKAEEINVQVPRHIAKVAAEVGSKLIYISTDYVFDGTKPPYKETDAPNPLNKYGITKLHGEKATHESYPGACILRVPILYGEVEYVDESAVTCLLSTILAVAKPSKVSDYEIRYPACTEDIATILLQLAQNLLKDPSLSGIFQWSGKEALTKYGMIKVIGDVFKLPYDHLTADPNPSPGAPRPYDSQLDSSRLESIGVGKHTPFRVGIEAALKKYVPVK